MKKVILLALLFVGGLSSWGAYNVRRPSDVIRPRWTGAKAGEWTMDYEAALAQAKATGKCTLLFVTGSWWCPHCEALEEKVLLSDAWAEMIAEKGYYLTMLDFPYRGTVKEAEVSKSKYPELGAGWGFQCWLYDDVYLKENGLSAEDGLREIMKRYELQKALAPASATQVTISRWDGSGDFTYGKVGYPTMIVFLPNGKEAGRFVPFVTYMEPEEARAYVLEQLDRIVDSALSPECVLCSDPEVGGLEGEAAQQYDGWISAPEGGLAGSISVKTGKKGARGEIKLKASVVLGGRKVLLSALTTDGREVVTLVKSSRDAFPVAKLRFGQEGLSGTLQTEEATYSVTGARITFLAKDPDARLRSALYEQGTWGFVMNPSTPDGGYGTFSISLKARGKATIRGTLGDGTKVNLTRQVIPGEDGAFCLPLIANLYKGGKGGFSCNLWFKNGWFFNVTDIGPWRNVDTATVPAFNRSWRPIYTALPGAGDVAAEMELVFKNMPTEFDGQPLAISPEFAGVWVSGNKWRGDGISRFDARCTSTTALLTGSMAFMTQRANGKIRHIKARVGGVVVGDAGYCSVVVPRKGSYAVKISACAACDE